MKLDNIYLSKKLLYKTSTLMQVYRVSRCAHIAIAPPPIAQTLLFSRSRKTIMASTSTAARTGKRSEAGTGPMVNIVYTSS